MNKPILDYDRPNEPQRIKAREQKRYYLWWLAFLIPVLLLYLLLMLIAFTSVFGYLR